MIDSEEMMNKPIAPIDILLVEDNEADVKVTLRAFAKSKLKNSIYVVGDGAEALDYVYRRGKYEDTQQYPRPDLILLDINLPKMNGFEVLEKLKQDESSRGIPVVMLTSSEADADIVRSYTHGAASYIPKPVNFMEFVKAIEVFNFYWQIISRTP